MSLKTFLEIKTVKRELITLAFSLAALCLCLFCIIQKQAILSAAIESNNLKVLLKLGFLGVNYAYPFVIALLIFSGLVSLLSLYSILATIFIRKQTKSSK